MRRQKKFLASLLSLTLFITSAPTQIFASQVEPTSKQQSHNISSQPLEDFEWVGGKIELNPLTYEVNFKVTSNCKTAYNGEISITNQSEITIEDWSLEFDFDKEVIQFWNADIIQHSDNRYIIHNKGYNANIAPGQTLKLGFTGKPSQGDTKPMAYKIIHVRSPLIIDNNISSETLNIGNQDVTTDRNDVMEDMEQLEIFYYSSDRDFFVTQNIILPKVGQKGSTISWRSSVPEIINFKGNVTRPLEISRNVELMATITKGNVSKTKVFQLKVIRIPRYTDIIEKNFEDLKELNGGEMSYDDAQIPRFIDGKYTEFKVESPTDAIASLNSVKKIFNIENPSQEFVSKCTDDMFGKKFYRLQQVYQGIEVYGRQLVVSTEEDGSVSSLSGNYSPNPRYAEINLIPKLTNTEALNEVKNICKGNFEVYNETLTIYSLFGEAPRLAWNIDIDGQDKEGNLMNRSLFIDAHTGEWIDNLSN